MNDEIIGRWNSVVNQGDVVYHLGDFALGRAENLREWPRKLKGTIVLITGNHDHKSVGFWAKLGIVAHKRPIIVNNMIFSHQPVIDPELPNIHGHTHNNNTNIAGIHICVSVEQINYTPIAIERVEEMICEMKKILS